MEKKERALSTVNQDIASLQQSATGLLKQLIATPSFSREEANTARILEEFINKHLPTERYGNNVVARGLHFDAAKPTLLLNSHHDTVKPNKHYTLDPFQPLEIDGKLYGLGSNDAGGCLVSLLAAFLYFHAHTDLPFNLVFAASAEEEISGTGGIEALLPHLGKVDYAVVGEPTLMQLAIAERGLMVLDCTAQGKAGHAARGEGENAIYKAMKDIEWINIYQFNKVSELLGPVKMTVTSIETLNKAHNVVPPECSFIVDVRINELYTMEEVLSVMGSHMQSEIRPRSLRLRSSSISPDHALVQAGLALGRTCYGSPTTSDKALMPFPALKMGPGDSARSHTADEFIYIEEIYKGIELYIDLINKLSANS